MSNVETRHWCCHLEMAASLGLQEAASLIAPYPIFSRAGGASSVGAQCVRKTSFLGNGISLRHQRIKNGKAGSVKSAPLLTPVGSTDRSSHLCRHHNLNVLVTKISPLIRETVSDNEAAPGRLRSAPRSFKFLLSHAGIRFGQHAFHQRPSRRS